MKNNKLPFKHKISFYKSGSNLGGMFGGLATTALSQAPNFINNPNAPKTSTAQDLTRQVGNQALNKVVPGLGSITQLGQQFADKLGKEECDPVTGECADASSTAANLGKSVLDPIGNLTGGVEKILSGNFQGALASSPVGMLLGVKDQKNEDKLAELDRRVRQRKLNEATVASNRINSQNLATQQNKYRSMGDNFGFAKKGGLLKFQDGGTRSLGMGERGDYPHLNDLYDKAYSKFNEGLSLGNSELLKEAYALKAEYLRLSKIPVEKPFVKKTVDVLPIPELDRSPKIPSINPQLVDVFPKEQERFIYEKDPDSNNVRNFVEKRNRLGNVSRRLLNTTNVPKPDTDWRDIQNKKNGGTLKYQIGGIASDSTKVYKELPKLKPKFSEVTKELFKSPQTRNAEIALQNREKNIESENKKNIAKNLVRAGLESLPFTSTAANSYGLIENAAKGNYIDAASYGAGLGLSFLPIPGASKFAKNIVRQGLKRFSQLGTANTATGKSFNDYKNGGYLKYQDGNSILDKISQAVQNPQMIVDSIKRSLGMDLNPEVKPSVKRYDLSKGKYGVQNNTDSPFNTPLPKNAKGIVFSNLDNLTFRKPSEYKQEQQGAYNVKGATYVGVGDSGSFYLGKLPNKDTAMVSPITKEHIITKARVNPDNKGIELLDEKGQPIYHNLENNIGNILMSDQNRKNPISYHSPKFESAQEAVDSTNAYINRNRGKAIYYKTDAGRFSYYPNNPKGLTKAQHEKFLLQSPVFNKGNSTGGGHYTYSETN